MSGSGVGGLWHEFDFTLEQESVDCAFSRYFLL